MEPTLVVSAVLTKIRQMRSELDTIETMLLQTQTRQPTTTGEATYQQILEALRLNPPTAPIRAGDVWQQVYDAIDHNPGYIHIKRAMIELGYVHHRRSDAIWYLPPHPNLTSEARASASERTRGGSITAS